MNEKDSKAEKTGRAKAEKSNEAADRASGRPVEDNEKRAEAAREESGRPRQEGLQEGRQSGRQETTGERCPLHPDTEMNATDEGVGVCPNPECEYSAQALVENRHPEMEERRRRERGEEIEEDRAEERGEAD